MDKKPFTILDKIDQLGLILFGESNKESLRSFGPVYQAGVNRSFETNEPCVGPKYALMKVTNRCNSGCVYCNHSIYSSAHLPNIEPTSQEVKHIIDEVASIGASSINITGGEPLLRQDLPEIVRYIHEKRLVSILLSLVF